MHAYKLIFMKEVLGSQKFSPETFLIRYYRTRIQNGKKKSLFVIQMLVILSIYNLQILKSEQKKKKPNYNTLSK